MTDRRPSDYDHLAGRLRERGVELDAVERALGAFAVETPSWGYGDSGTRFAVFTQAGRPRTVLERLDDAAEVHRLTGAAPAVALHFPWDAVDDLAELRAHAEGLGLRIGAVNPNLFQDPDYRLGSVTHPDAAIRDKAVAHLVECVGIARELGSTAQSLWFADGTNYAGQDDLRGRRARLIESLARVYEALPAEQELLLEYKPYEPAFYATDLFDWGAALTVCNRLGERAKVLVDLGHHLQGANVEQIVALLDDEGRLGGFHFNNRKYGDDDLIVGSTNPWELFLIFVELGATLPRLTIDQSHNVEAKVEAMTLSVVNLQEAYAKALLVDRGALAAAHEAGDVLGGHEVLLDAYRTDVRPLCAKVRDERGAAADPVASLRSGGYHERTIAARGSDVAVAGGVGPVTVATPIAHRTEDRWPAEIPAGALDQLVLRSNLLGADRAVANFGGGNTSVKTREADHAGREIDVLWVKGSGSDLATMDASGFTGLRLQEILPLYAREAMSDEKMVAYLARCQLEPSMPRCSIETLLHAFVPAAHVDHTHPDAINAIAGAVDGKALAHSCFGDAVAWIDYIRPGFSLARQVGEAIRAGDRVRIVILAKHGLVTWGDSADESYRATIDAINRAADFVNERTNGSARFGGARHGALLDDHRREELLAQLLPALRGAVSSERAKVLHVDTSPPVLELLDSERAPDLVSVGAPCPDHLVHTKRVPLWVPFDPARDDAGSLAQRIAAGAVAYREDYRAYVERFGDAATVAADPDPRVVLVQHVGLVACGPTVKAARLSRDLYLRAIEVMAGADALGGFVSLTAQESFAIEYWPLELFKLSLAPPAGELQGKVALVTGAAGGIGRAIVDALSAAGACAVAFDLDGDGARDAVAALGDRGLAVAGDVTSEDAVAGAFAATVERFGGVDIVVSNAGLASSAPIQDTTLEEWSRNHAVLGTGYFLVAREAFRVLERQGTGGSVVFVASKNALVAGRNAAAYSSAKAAELHLARCLAEEGGSAGIRVNTVNPDAVLSGSRIWDSSWREERAANYGIAPDELEEHYRSRTTLGVNIEPEDIAAAVLHFASDARSGKTTGNLLNVDGGVPAAYPR